MHRHGLRHFLPKTSKLLLPLICLPGAAVACPLALVLAIDVSRSVDPAEYTLQFNGLASAFRDADFQAAILAFDDPIAGAAFEWSGQDHQKVIADWTFLSDADAIERLAARLEEQRRSDYGQHTAIGSAVAFAHSLLELGPNCSWQAIDVSSDGYNNDGRTPGQVYGLLDFSEVTVNALVIGGETRPALKRYFETDVIHGPGAFALGTVSFADYPEAIRMKLLRELKQLDVATAAGGG